jgi:hypothetical protein
MKKQRYGCGCTGPTSNNANRSTRGGDSFFDSHSNATRTLITGLSDRAAALTLRGTGAALVRRFPLAKRLPLSQEIKLLADLPSGTLAHDPGAL